MSVFKGMLALLGLVAVMVLLLHQAVPHGQRTPTGLLENAMAHAKHEADAGGAGQVGHAPDGLPLEEKSPLEKMIASAGYACGRIQDVSPDPGNSASFKVTCVTQIGQISERSYLVDTYKGTATAL